MSLRYSTLLNAFIDWADEEIAAGKKYLKWEEVTLKWENVNLLWEEVFILLELEGIIKKGGGYGAKEYEDGNPWKQLRKEIGEEKTKKTIKLYCKVNGKEYDESRDIEDERIKVTVNEFERFVKMGINVKVQPEDELISTISKITSPKIGEAKYSREDTLILINSYISKISEKMEDASTEELQEIRRLLLHISEKYVSDQLIK